MAGRYLRSSVCGSVASLGLLAGGHGLAHAQDQERAFEVEEIIVTATKRDETLLDVPLSISVTSAESLEQRSTKNLEDLARSVAGLVVQQESVIGDKSLLIRGIGASSDRGTVAVYIDDTPITFGSNTPDLKVFDVDRIEVVRGPQGTLFGSNAMGGAIRYVSPRPDFGGTSGLFEIEAAQLQGGGSDYEVQAAFGGPLRGDWLAGRISGFARRDAGYVDLFDEDDGTRIRSNINAADSFGGRLTLDAAITDRLDATFSLIYQEQNEGFPNSEFTGRRFSPTVALPDQARVARTDVFRDDRIILPNLTVNADLGFAELTSSTSYVSRKVDRQDDYSAFVQAALGLNDAAGRNLVVVNEVTDEAEAYTQELRLTSQSEGPWAWLVGAYHQKTDEPRRQFDPSNLGTVLPSLAGGLLAEGSVFDSIIVTERTQTALFGELSYVAFDRLTLTGGLRVTEIELDVFRRADGLFNGGLTQSQSQSSETPVTPKVSVSYELSPQSTIYATAAKGFREGGPNLPAPLALTACVRALAALGLTQAPETYESDSLWSYEIGGKHQSQDGRLRLGATAFHIDWTGIQQTINLSGGCGFTYVDNSGEATSQGFEAEAALRATDALSFDVSLAYTDAKLAAPLISGANASGPVVAAPEGRRLPNVPRWAVSASGRYDVQLGSDISAYLRAEIQYVGSTLRSLGTPTDDPRVYERDAYTVVNLRAAVQKGPYELALFATNVTDEDVTLYETYEEFAPGTAAERTRLRPRTIGASVRRTF